MGCSVIVNKFIEARGLQDIENIEVRHVTQLRKSANIDWKLSPQRGYVFVKRGGRRISPPPPHAWDMTPLSPKTGAGSPAAEDLKLKTRRGTVISKSELFESLTVFPVDTPSPTGGTRSSRRQPTSATDLNGDVTPGSTRSRRGQTDQPLLSLDDLPKRPRPSSSRKAKEKSPTRVPDPIHFDEDDFFPTMDDYVDDDDDDDYVPLERSLTPPPPASAQTRSTRTRSSRAGRSLTPPPPLPASAAKSPSPSAPRVERSPDPSAEQRYTESTPKPTGKKGKKAKQQSPDQTSSLDRMKEEMERKMEEERMVYERRMRELEEKQRQEIEKLRQAVFSSDKNTTSLFKAPAAAATKEEKAISAKDQEIQRLRQAILSSTKRTKSLFQEMQTKTQPHRREKRSDETTPRREKKPEVEKKPARRRSELSMLQELQGKQAQEEVKGTRSGKPDRHPVPSRTVAGRVSKVVPAARTKGGVLRTSTRLLKPGPRASKLKFLAKLQAKKSRPVPSRRPMSPPAKPRLKSPECTSASRSSRRSSQPQQTVPTRPQSAPRSRVTGRPGPRSAKGREAALGVRRAGGRRQGRADREECELYAIAYKDEQLAMEARVSVRRASVKVVQPPSPRATPVRRGAPPVVVGTIEGMGVGGGGVARVVLHPAQIKQEPLDSAQGEYSWDWSVSMATSVTKLSARTRVVQC